jgi:hypothetical protein
VDPCQVKKALAWFEEALNQDTVDGFVIASEAKEHLALVSAHDDLSEAVQGAEYVQESEICKWRDRLVRKIRRLKEEDPHP